MMLLEVYNVPVDSVDQDEAVAALAAARVFASEFERQEIPIPERLSGRIEELQREVTLKRRDYLERALRAAKMKRDAYKSRDQKLSETNEAIAKIEAQLQK